MEVLRNVSCIEYLFPRSNAKILIYSFACLAIRKTNMKKRRGLAKEVLVEFTKGKPILISRLRFVDLSYFSLYKLLYYKRT